MIGRLRSTDRPSGNDVGRECRHKARIFPPFCSGENGRRCGLHDDARRRQTTFCDLRSISGPDREGNSSTSGLWIEERGIVMWGVEATVVKTIRSQAPHKLCDVGNNRDRAVLLKAARCVS